MPTTKKTETSPGNTFFERIKRKIFLQTPKDFFDALNRALELSCRPQGASGPKALPNCAALFREFRESDSMQSLVPALDTAVEDTWGETKEEVGIMKVEFVDVSEVAPGGALLHPVGVMRVKR
jgi:hypothetical protein